MQKKRVLDNDTLFICVNIVNTLKRMFMGSSFNKEQEKAICHGQGPAMVLAGPGSGKTLVITYRVKWLIEKLGVHPSNILVITFTRAAADEMKKRFQNFEGMEKAPVMFGTFHAIFFMMLRYAYRYSGSNIVREHDRRRYIKEIVEEMELEIEDENEFYTGILNEISYVKGEMMSLSLYHSNNLADELFEKIYQGYENKLRADGYLDFDDMLVFCHDLLKQRPDILKMWQDRFQYILIDEFQDINRVQYEIVKMLAGERANLFVVGDDDQSIYRFRGAKPEIMLGFEKDYKTTKKIILNVNYRSSQEIVESAERLILNNKKRFAKDMKAARGSKVPVVYRKVENATKECNDIIGGIGFYLKKGIPLEEMAVIFRTNTQPRLLVGRLMEYNIPFQMRDLIPNIFEHWIAKNIITYLKLASGQMERSPFLSVMNRPKRYISRKMIQDSPVDFQQLKRQCIDKKWLFEKVDKMEIDLMHMRNKSTYDAITYLRKEVGYESYLEEYAQFRKMNFEDLLEVLDQIQETAKEHETFSGWFTYIEEYGEELKHQMEAGRVQDQRGITLTTMHSSKGLEYEVVFVMDVNEGICPHKKAVKNADLEEERRLFYVAVTRAKTYLFMYSLKELFQKDAKPSRYITEIMYDSKTYAIGNKVKHEKFGIGVIEKVEAGKITVNFEGDKRRRFALDYVIDHHVLSSVR